MNGSVTLTVDQLELIDSDRMSERAVRVTANDPATGDHISIAVYAPDAPPIGATITIRIEQHTPPAAPTRKPGGTHGS